MRIGFTLHLYVSLLALVTINTSAFAGTPVAVPAAQAIAGKATNAYDAFGAAVGASGLRIAVGSRGADEGYYNSGAVHLYFRKGEQWVEQPRILAPVPQESSQFGHAIAMDANRIAIGAPRFDASGISDVGHVFIYRWDLGMLIPEQELDLSVVDLNVRQFGSSLALANTLLASGSPATIGGGRVDVFNADKGSWIHQSTLTSPISIDGDGFGTAIATDAQWLIVGSPGDDTLAQDAGAAFIFEWTGAMWALATVLRPTELGEGAGFGGSIALHGDDLLIGAYRHDTAGQDSGSVFRYRYLAGNWFAAEEFVPNPTLPGMEFGASVALDEDWFVIGAPSDGSIDARSGSIFMLPRSDSVSPVPLRMTIPDSQGLELLGTSVAIGESIILGGAPLYSITGEYSGGMLYIDRLLDCDIDNQADFISTAILMVDDCDIDGIPDVCQLNPDTDCDDSGVLDVCEIANGTLPDSNGDGIPDECQCTADIDGNGFVDIGDLLTVVGYWGSSSSLGDVNNDGIVDVTDLLLVINNWGPCE